jgi:copper homeostasis protein
MCRDIAVARDLGVEGVVCGALDVRGNIDTAVTEQLVKAAAGMSFTFHRAFDACSNPFEAVRVLVELGVGTLLTSGQAVTAEAGKGLIQELVEWAQPQGLTVMPGCGLHVGNIADVVSETGARAVHLSARKMLIQSAMRFFNDHCQTDVEMVRRCRLALDSL